jgi:hypothetical protein
MTIFLFQILKLKNKNQYLDVWQHAFDQSLISSVNLHHWTQLTLTLGRFLSQNVTSERLLVFEAVSGFFKTLSRTTIRFHFWHNKNSPRIRLIFFTRNKRQNPQPTFNKSVTGQGK